MTKNEILQLINDGITTKVAPFSITQVDLGNIMTEMVNLSVTTFMTGTNISVSGTGLETDPFILEMTADTNTYLTEGSDMSITGDGSITTPYVISFTAGTIPWSPGSSGNFNIKTDNDSTTDATDDYATAQGFNTLASGQASHAEGSGTIASSTGAHAEGVSTTANNTGAHAEGNGTLASGTASHAEGNGTTASGIASHAEGRDTSANGEGSHSEGCDTIADGDYSHSSGIFNTAQSFGERAIGSFGTNYTANSTTTFDSVDRLFNIGNGASSISRADAFTVLKSGEVGIDIDNFEANKTGVNKLEVNGSVYSDQYRLSALNTAPSSAADTGTTGEIRITSGFIYVCVATDTWVRSALASW